MKKFFSSLLAIALSLSLIGCSDLNISDFATGEALRDRIEAFPLPDIKSISFNNNQTTLSEAAPPILIRKLGQIIDKYRPQVSILEPSPDKVFDDTKVTVQLKVTDYPLFKDENLEMGPHLHLILDNQPYQAIYSVDEPVILENLEPGTHTLRVFAARPWHESFKNEGAYAETTFHVLTKTQANNPDPQLPLLTYSRPKGTYGAEPIMLDFYLSHLPSREIVRNSAIEGFPTWRVKATINGESFILDQWQPVYLRGFKEGNNWIQLELIDDQANSIKNIFNNTVRLITYNPDLEDSLARIVTGEIALENAIAIVDPNYEVPLEETVQGVSVEVVEENVIEKKAIPAEKSEVIEEKVNQETEIVTETPEVTEDPIVEPEITQDDVILENNQQLSDTQDNIPVDKLKVVDEEVDLEPEPATTIPEETTIPEISQLTESAIRQSLVRRRDRVVMIANQEIIEPKGQNFLPETTKVLENSSVSETDTDQVTDLVTISKEPFHVTVNLDQWVGDYLRIFRDKISETYHIFIK